MAKPKPGDKIYVFSTMHLHHGADDFQGGLCTVVATETRQQAHQEVTFVEVEEDPGRWILWETYLEPKQDELKKAFGEEAGRLRPDLRPEFNDGWGPERD
jgi:hypothetical protein